MKYWAIRIAQPLVARVPWLFYGLAAVVGPVCYRLMPGMRGRVLRNMVVPLEGDRKAARSAGKQVFKNVCRYYVDLGSMPRRDPTTFEGGHIEVENEQWLNALFAPRPTIIVSAHLGNPELALVGVTGRGRPFVELVEALEPAKLGEFFTRLREGAGGEVHELGFGGTRRCIKELRNGGLVALLADRDLPGNGVGVTVCERRVHIARGPWELARRTGATVVPLFLERVGGRDRLRVHLEEPFAVTSSADAEGDVRAAAQRWARVFEKHLVRDPGQWTVTEDYWVTHACREG